MLRRRLTGRQQALIEANKRLFRIIKDLSLGEIYTKNPFNVFSVFCISKLCITAQAVNLLSGNGFGEDGMVLSRSIFELYLKHASFAKDHDGFRRYIESDAVQRLNIVNSVKSNPELQDEYTQSFFRENAELIKNIEADVAGLENPSLKEFKFNVKDAADALGMGYAYESIYKLQCNAAHSNSRAMSTYLRESALDGGEFKVTPDYQDVELACVITFDFGLRLLESINNDLGLEIEQKINLLKNHYLTI